MASAQLGAGEWIGLLGLAVAGLGAFFGWIHQRFGGIHQRITTLEGEMRDWVQLNAAQDVQLERVKTCQENTRLSLDKIEDTARQLHDKLDAVLLAFKK